MREILTSQLNVLVLLILVFLAGNIKIFSILRGTGSDNTPTECTISTIAEMKAGIVKTAKFASGTDCEAMRQLAEEGKPLPTIIDSTSKPTP